MKDLLTETVIKQLRELIEDRKSFIISDAEHDEIYEKDIEALETAIRYAEIVAEMDKPLHDKAEQIMRHYGADKQLVILVEECSELAKEACKCMRDGKPYSADMVEEMADVQIMLMQFRRILPRYWLERLYETVRMKLDRQLERIENGE